MLIRVLGKKFHNGTIYGASRKGANRQGLGVRMMRLSGVQQGFEGSKHLGTYLSLGP